MEGKVLTIDGTKAAKQRKPAKKREPSRKYSYYSEDPQAEYLLTSTDEQGKAIYFFKINITGLRDRVFGPYHSRATAVNCFDTVLKGSLEAFCEVRNIGRAGRSGMEHISLPSDLKPVPCGVGR